MQTGTTPGRRIVTEPASGRSAPITGACRVMSTTEPCRTSSDAQQGSAAEVIV